MTSADFSHGTRILSRTGCTLQVTFAPTQLMLSPHGPCSTAPCSSCCDVQSVLISPHSCPPRPRALVVVGSLPCPGWDKSQLRNCSDPPKEGPQSLRRLPQQRGQTPIARRTDGQVEGAYRDKDFPKAVVFLVETSDMKKPSDQALGGSEQVHRTDHPSLHPSCLSIPLRHSF